MGPHAEPARGAIQIETAGGKTLRSDVLSERISSKKLRKNGDFGGLIAVLLQIVKVTFAFPKG
jgi:hypothetical protein